MLKLSNPDIFDRLQKIDNEHCTPGGENGVNSIQLMASLAPLDALVSGKLVCTAALIPGMILFM